MENNQQIIFFDGVCNICNAFVDFVMKRDPERKFVFAPLQGESAKRYLGDKSQLLKSMALWSQGQILEKSDAALSVIQQLGGFWYCFGVFWIVPKWLRDLVYDFVARNRYRIFGKRETCRLPTPEERALFLN